MWPVASRLLPPNHREVIERGSYRIIADLEDQLNRMLLFFGARYEGVWEPGTMALLKELARGARTVVTAGSHIGFVNLEILSALRPEGMIFTFEPASGLFARTVENIALNGAEDRIRAFRAAISDASGEGELFVSNLRTSLIAYTADHSSRAVREKVPLKTLDGWKSEQGIGSLDLLVLDIEGYELRALRGAEGILRDDRPALCLEVARKITNEEDAGALFAFLAERGYGAWAIDDDYSISRLRKGRPGLPRLVNARELAPAGGYYNVLAAPKGHAAMDIVETLCQAR